jgi:hypothetical protein
MADQPPADLRARIAEAIRAAAHDCDGLCGLTEGECDREHPIQVAVLLFGEVTDVYGGIEALAEVAHAAVQPELDQLRAERETLRIGSLERAALLEDARDALEAAGQTGAHGDDWPAIAPAIAALAAGRDRLRAELAAARCACYPHPADHEDHCPRAAAPTATT